MIDPGKTYDYTSPECNRRSGVEKRVINPGLVKIDGVLHYSSQGEWIWKENRRTTTQRKVDRS